MHKLSIFVAIFMFGCFLVGCGPVYKREYAFVPPKSDIAKMCTAQCIQSKSACEQICQANNAACRARARERAYYEFEMYRYERLRAGKRVKKTVSNFENNFSCPNTCDCEPAYRACYSACGGQVLERDVCVAFCDQ